MKHQIAQHSARRRRLRKGGPHSPRDRLFEQRSSRCRGTPLLVPKSRLDSVKRVTREATRAFTVGDPPDPKTAVGPMVSQKQYGRRAILHPQGYRRGRTCQASEATVCFPAQPEIIVRRVRCSRANEPQLSEVRRSTIRLQSSGRADAMFSLQ